MIGYIEGKLLKKEDDRILLLANQVGYEILLPPIVMETLSQKANGDELSLYIFYQQTEKQPKPVLIGFNLEAEKDFFQHFITVEDIGPLKALKALHLPMGEIARAIETEDAAFLTQLKGVGKRTAHKIIASLQGKMTKFALIAGEEPRPTGKIPDFSQQVMEVLVNQLGHRTSDARRLISQAIERNSSISNAEALFDEVYRGSKIP